MNKHSITDHTGRAFDSIKSMCAYYHISTNVFARRQQRGWGLERILTTPVHYQNQKQAAEKKSFILDHLAREYPDLEAMCQAYHLDMLLFQERRLKGWTLEEILTTPTGECDECRVDHLGHVYENLHKMCDFYDVPYHVFRYRIENNWGLEKALTTPVGKQAVKCKDHLNQDFSSLKEMCHYYEIPFRIYQNRIRAGWDLERALTEPVKRKSKRKK